jgi:hypothetical protein
MLWARWAENKILRDGVRVIFFATLNSLATHSSLFFGTVVFDVIYVCHSAKLLVDTTVKKTTTERKLLLHFS